MRSISMRRQLTRRRLAATGIGLAGMLALAACGGDPGGTEESEEPAATGGATSTVDQPDETTPSPTEPATETPAATVEPVVDDLGPDGHFREVQESEDGTRHLIPLNKIQSGGPPKDGIPSIDDPQFVTIDEWDEMNYLDDLLVIGVEVDGQHRAYPFQVLVWHELVNDTFNEVPLLISYCPLCGTGIVFVREVEVAGGPVEFGVSGQLYNSDLLMYDRYSDTLWSQISGTAVVGELTGERLEYYPSQIMTWVDWRNTYPDSHVLSRETGHNRNYDSLPYGGYDESSSIWFSVTDTDDRLHMKERVVGVELDSETFCAYPEAAIVESGPVNDILGETPLLVAADSENGDNIVVFVREVNGQVLTFTETEGQLTDAETGSVWSFAGLAIEGELAGEQLEEVIPVKGFWFAWFAFHQETELWQPES